MLNDRVSTARGIEPPWDGARASRVLQSALRARRASRRSRPIGWPLVLVGASLATVFLARSPSAANGEPTGVGSTTEPAPAVVSSPADQLDAGKQRG